MASIIEEHHNPALAALLELIERDVATGRNVRALPATLAAAMRRAVKEVRADLDGTLEGDVALSAAGNFRP